ncbi:AMP-binding enzyme [Niveomyces insectorum RCEF 264]|uniref:AMP-binding enzyme n=1 Tax=Niveomyces insectorum RCEF 264 TaxID=1081102 RepID=A0A167TAV8_9HYPO|nr:AMP-binding enzyme [Niveomyces insectorum RCEF 264]
MPALRPSAVVLRPFGWQRPAPALLHAPRRRLSSVARLPPPLALSPPPPPPESPPPASATAPPPLLTCTIPEHFASIVARYPDHPAVVCRAPPAPHDVGPATQGAGPAETTYTYAALDCVSDLLARNLQARLGVRAGDRVAVSLGNTPEFAALTYAVFKLGAVLVPLNPAFTAAQVGGPPSTSTCSSSAPSRPCHTSRAAGGATGRCWRR